MYLIDEDDRLIVRLAELWREGVLPEPGGALAQPVATAASIRIVLTAWLQLEQARFKKE